MSQDVIGCHRMSLDSQEVMTHRVPRRNPTLLQALDEVVVHPACDDVRVGAAQVAL
jgi:hypothetical protein